jgi:hypothetical protein
MQKMNDESKTSQSLTPPPRPPHRRFSAGPGVAEATECAYDAPVRVMPQRFGNAESLRSRAREAWSRMTEDEPALGGDAGSDSEDEDPEVVGLVGGGRRGGGSEAVHELQVSSLSARLARLTAQFSPERAPHQARSASFVPRASLENKAAADQQTSRPIAQTLASIAPLTTALSEGASPTGGMPIATPTDDPSIQHSLPGLEQRAQLYVRPSGTKRTVSHVLQTARAAQREAGRESNLSHSSDTKARAAMDGGAPRG